MRWIASSAPIYVWDGDTWYNEKDQQIYVADVCNHCWSHAWKGREKGICFTKKTKILSKTLSSDTLRFQTMREK